jgi:hypothetical protein
MPTHIKDKTIDFHKFYAFLHDELQLFLSIIYVAERQDTTLFEDRTNVDMFQESLKIR